MLQLCLSKGQPAQLDRPSARGLALRRGCWQTRSRQPPQRQCQGACSSGAVGSPAALPGHSTTALPHCAAAACPAQPQRSWHAHIEDDDCHIDYLSSYMSRRIIPCCWLLTLDRSCLNSRAPFLSSFTLLEGLPVASSLPLSFLSSATAAARKIW